VLAVLAVVVLALGGWALLGRGGGTPADPAAATVRPGPTSPASDPLGAPADRASRDTERMPVAPQLGRLAPARTSSTPAATATTTPAPTSTAATTSPAATPTRRPKPGQPRPTATTSAPAPAPTSSSYADEVTRLTNAERAKAGCAAVRTDDRLAAAALAHSQDMVDRDYFSHTSPDGEGPGDRAAAAGYPSWSGENIAAGYTTPAAVVAGWMNSSGHRANILNCDSKATGVGFDPRGNMWTQMFGFV
jgi:uncharacterized protein YkwD